MSRRGASEDDARDEARSLAEQAVRALDLGPPAEQPSLLPRDGPRLLFDTSGATLLVLTAARVRSELAGHARAEAHPLRPRLVGATERVIAWERTVGPAREPIAALCSALEGPIEVRTATLRQHLDALSGPVSLTRALARTELGRSRIDRLLATEVRVSIARGPTLGGLHPGWLRERADGGVVALSLRHALGDGWPLFDLAAAARALELDVREPAIARHDDVVAADAALRVASLAIALRELVMGHDPHAREDAIELAMSFVEDDRASEVDVHIEAPPWVDTRAWLPTGARVAASRARFLVRTLDGVSIGGARVSVRTEPKVRAGRASPVWEPLEERRARLFSRWAAGIRTDDEGLYSATPEALAERIAAGHRGVVIDGTCGIGSIAIALARRPEVTRVVAVDTSAERLAMARHNASLYGVGARIEWAHEDVARVIDERRADALVLDPPWGGRDWDRERTGLAELGMDVRPLIARFAGAITLKLPRSFDVGELPPGFVPELLVDARGIPKMIVARRA